MSDEKLRSDIHSSLVVVNQNLLVDLDALLDTGTRHGESRPTAR